MPGWAELGSDPNSAPEPKRRGGQIAAQVAASTPTRVGPAQRALNQPGDAFAKVKEEAEGRGTRSKTHRPADA
jgi:hypothetical protein